MNRYGRPARFRSQAGGRTGIEGSIVTLKRHCFNRANSCPGLLSALLTGLLLAGTRGVSQSLKVPPRPPGAPTGSEFINIITRMPLTERENWIYAQVLDGNVPNFLRTLAPVTVSATISGTLFE